MMQELYTIINKENLHNPAKYDMNLNRYNISEGDR